MRTTTITGVELDATGADLGNLPITITLESTSDLPLVFKNAADGADPDNKKLLNTGAVLSLTTDLAGLWSTPLVAPGDIAGLDSGGGYVAVTAWYSITRGVVTTTTTSFAYSGTPLSVGTLSASQAFPGITTAAMTLDVGTVGAAADPGEIVTVRISQDCTAVCDDTISTVALYASTPYTATTDSNGHAVLPLVPSSRLPAGVFYWASLHIGSAQYSFAVPDDGGPLFGNLITPITTGQTTVLAPNLRDRGPWVAGGTYAVHDVAHYAGQLFLCILTPVGLAAPGFNNQYWQRVGITVGYATLSGLAVSDLGAVTDLAATAGSLSSVGSHLTAGVTEYYAVSTADENLNEGVPCAAISFVVPTPKAQVDLSWTPRAGALDYYVYRGTAPEALGYLGQTGTSITTFIDTGNYTPGHAPLSATQQGVIIADGDITTGGSLYQGSHHVVLDDGTNLPAAGASQLGGIKVGAGLSIDGSTHVLSATATGADATTTAPGLLELRTAASGAHPVALTTDDLGTVGGPAYLDSSFHALQQPTRDATEAATNDTLASSSTIINNLNRLRYQLAQLGTGAWSSLRAMVQLSPGGQQTGTINVSGEVQASDFAPGGLTGSVAASRYVGATASVAPTTGAHLLGDWVPTQDGKVFICTSAGTPGTWTQVSGSGTFSGEVAGTDFASTGLTGSTAASRYVGATASGAPASGAHLLGDFVIDQTGKVWVCTTAGTPGTWTLAGGGSTFAGEVQAPDYKATGLTGATAASRYAGATASGAPASGTFAVGDYVIDHTGAVWVCTAAGSPGSWVAAGGGGGGGGTVTSVALTVPGDLSVSGSPVTGSGTLAVTRGTQSANQGLFGPTTGSPDVPAYRALVSADLPSAPTVSGEVTASDFKPAGLTGSTAASRYVGATASGAPASGAHLLGDFVIEQTGKVYVCTTAGTPGTWTQVGGSSITTASAQLGTDVTSVTTTYVDALTLTLAAGTWLLLGALTGATTSAAGDMSARLTDGSTNLASGTQSVRSATASVTISIFAVVTPTGSTTYHLQGSCDTTAAIKAATNQQPAGNTATTFLAVKLA